MLRVVAVANGKHTQLRERLLDSIERMQCKCSSSSSSSRMLLDIKFLKRFHCILQLETSGLDFIVIQSEDFRPGFCGLLASVRSLRVAKFSKIILHYWDSCANWVVWFASYVNYWANHTIPNSDVNHSSCLTTFQHNSIRGCQTRILSSILHHLSPGFSRCFTVKTIISGTLTIVLFCIMSVSISQPNLTDSHMMAFWLVVCLSIFGFCSSQFESICRRPYLT